MQKLIIQLAEANDGVGYTLNWWCFNQNQLVQHDTLVAQQKECAEQLAQSLSEYLMFDEVVIIPPAHRIHFRHLDVSKKQKKHLRQMTPFLMEPFVGQSVDELHFVVQADKGTCTVMAAAKERVLLWRSFVTDLVAVNILILPPQGFAKGIEEGEYRSVLGSLLTLANEQLCYVPPALAAIEEEGGNNLDDIQVFYQTLESDITLRQLNLLQGEFAPPSTLGKRIKSWAIVAAIVFCALLVQVLDMHWQAQQVTAKAQTVEDKAKALYLKLVPEEGRVVNLSRQLKARLRGVSSTEVDHIGKTPYDFLARLDQAKSQLDLVDGLQQIAFREGVYRFEWLATSRAQLDGLRDLLAKDGEKVQLEQVVRADNKYRGVYKVEQQ